MAHKPIRPLAFAWLCCFAASGLPESAECAPRGDPNRNPVRALAFSPDGKYLAAGRWNGEIELRDPLTGKIRRTLKGHEVRVFRLEFSCDGNSLVSTDYHAVIRRWDLKRFQSKVIWQLPEAIDIWLEHKRKLTWHGGTLTAILHDLETGKRLQTFGPHTDGVVATALSADGKFLATGEQGPTIRVWKVSSGRQIAKFGGKSGAIYQLQFTSNGKRLISSAADFTLRIWNPKTGRQLASFHDDHAIFRFGLSPDKKLLAIAGIDRVLIWSMADSKLLATVKAGTQKHTSVFVVAFSPDGKRLAAGMIDGTVSIWRLSKLLPTKRRD